MDEPSFLKAVNFVLAHEGGLSFDAQDPGGPTNFGVSLRFLKNSGIDINADGVFDVEDIKDMTVNKARDIYKTEFWEKYKFYKIRSLPISCKVFDLAVNTGPYTSISRFQATLNSYILGNVANMHPLNCDGIIGPLTEAVADYVIDEVGELKVLRRYCSEMEQYYRSISTGVGRSHLKKYLKGWLTRVYNLPSYIWC